MNKLTRAVLTAAVVMGGYYGFVDNSEKGIKDSQIDAMEQRHRQEGWRRLGQLQEKYNQYLNSGDRSSFNKYLTNEELEELRQLFIYFYSPMAVNTAEKYNLPASIVMAQCMLESGCGSSNITREANNFFAKKHIKHCKKKYSGVNLGCCMQQHDDFHYDRFVRYADAEKSFSDYGRLLNTERYQSVFKMCEPGDYECFAKALKEAGYATDPEYASKLVAHIEANSLQALDHGGEYKINWRDVK